MGVRAQVTMTNNFGAVTDEITDRLRVGVALAAERLLALSSAEVPLDQGTLMGSGSVSTPLAQTGEVVAEVVFDTPYATRLHEHPEYTFQNGRKGKYLEDPALENKAELGDIIRKQVRGG